MVFCCALCRENYKLKKFDIRVFSQNLEDEIRMLFFGGHVADSCNLFLLNLMGKLILQLCIVSLRRCIGFKFDIDLVYFYLFALNVRRCYKESQYNVYIWFGWMGKEGLILNP